MNLFNRTLTAASLVLAFTLPGPSSAMSMLVSHDTVIPQIEQMQLLHGRLQWLETQMRDLEAEILRTQEALRRNEIAPWSGALDTPRPHLTPGPQANTCPRQEGGQAGGSCGTAGIMEGMMQMMGQMMRALMQ